MAQTNNGMSFIDASLEISIDGGATWVNASGHATKVDVSGGDREIGETATLDGDIMIVTVGKRAALEITVSTVYTEVAGEPSEVIRAAYEGHTQTKVRWSPKGGQSGEFMYTSDAGYIGSYGYPAGEAKSGDAILNEWKIKVPQIVKSVVA
jgi:hypothetical protein